MKKLIPIVLFLVASLFLVAANKTEVINGTLVNRVPSAEVTDIVMPTADLGAAEVTDITVVANDGNSLSSKYFLLTVGGDSLTFNVWFDASNASTRPTGGSTVGTVDLEVNVLGDDSDGTIATNLAAALDANQYFGASSSGNVVTVTNAHIGAATDAVNGTTVFGFGVTTPGADSQYAGTYFTFTKGGSSEITRYGWFSMSNSTAVDPAPNSSWTGTEIAVTAGDESTTIATTAETALDALTDFSASATDNTVRLTCADEGTTLDPGSGTSPVFTKIVVEGVPVVYDVISSFTLYDFIKVGITATTNENMADAPNLILQVSPVSSGDVWYDTAITLQVNGTAGVTENTAPAAVYGKRARLIARSSASSGNASITLTLVNY